MERAAFKISQKWHFTSTKGRVVTQGEIKGSYLERHGGRENMGRAFQDVQRERERGMEQGDSMGKQRIVDGYFKGRLL